MSQHLICHEYKQIPHIDNTVQHIQVELMWERGKLKCNTYNMNEEESNKLMIVFFMMFAKIV